MVFVPAGDFCLGSDDSDEFADDNERPRHQLCLPAFWIGRYPVTNLQYQQFLLANPDHAAPDDWDGRDFSPAKTNHPVMNVSWYDTMDYCRWLYEATGKEYTLPSEAEWEKAARGTEGYIYPWGDEFSRDRFNWRVPGTNPVGMYSPWGDSPYGCADMAGIYVWTRSLYRDYPYRVDDGREDMNDSKGTRVVRGGGWFDNHWVARCAYRAGISPVYFISFLGFRVACPQAQ
jgi:formylglycine-generating enzyme required for sulfatase activity